jgi:hypothetical protein
MAQKALCRSTHWARSMVDSQIVVTAPKGRAKTCLSRLGSVGRQTLFFYCHRGGSSPPEFYFIDLSLMDPSVYKDFITSVTSLFVDKYYWLHRGSNIWHQASATDLSFFGSLIFHNLASSCVSMNTCRWECDSPLNITYLPHSSFSKDASSIERGRWCSDY